MIHICSFASRISDLTKKQIRDTRLVLECLLSDPMVSTWDMDDGRCLYRKIDDLKALGYIDDKTAETSYPWHKFVVTESGKQYLEEK